MTSLLHDSGLETQRLDKWLWAARFFKTRSLAAEAVTGGKVHVEGQRVKPAKLVKPGARITIRRGTLEWDLMLRGLAKQRRPAPEAALLYEETPESIERRTREVARRRQEAVESTRGMGRPTKKNRRRLATLKGR